MNILSLLERNCCPSDVQIKLGRKQSFQAVSQFTCVYCFIGKQWVSLCSHLTAPGKEIPTGVFFFTVEISALEKVLGQWFSIGGLHQYPCASNSFGWHFGLHCLLWPGFFWFLGFFGNGCTACSSFLSLVQMRGWRIHLSFAGNNLSLVILSKKMTNHVSFFVLRGEATVLFGLSCT